MNEVVKPKKFRGLKAPEDKDPTGRGRPLTPINIEAVERGAQLGCNPDELAVLAGISRSAFYERMDADPDLVAAIERGRAQGRESLRRLQWQAANAGNPAMLIWLGKQLLGQRDKTELTGAEGGPMQMQTVSLDVADLSPEQRAALRAAMVNAKAKKTP